MRIMTILGARPQFIKAAAVSREIINNKSINEVIVHTGQHYDSNMSDVFFEEMDIPKPDYNLKINSLSHGAMTGQMLEKIEVVILKEKPDYVMVYGDTNSTLAGALAASKLHVPVAHVEAGLRSFNMYMPEEINRILTDRVSNLLFCPTETAVKNLEKEGFNNFKCEVIKSGDVMQDAALFYSPKSELKSTIVKDLKLKDFILVTIHRAENTDSLEKMHNIFKALNIISKEINVVLPMHPRTKNKISSTNIDVQKINIIDPVGYFDMIQLLKKCSLVMTDSGGLQKEAFFFSKPCITLREETEWVELVEGGYNVLAGSDKSTILNGFKNMVDKKILQDELIYGGGKASSNIVKSILSIKT